MQDSKHPLSIATIISGLIITILGGVIVSWIVQDGRFSDNPSSTTSNGIPIPLPAPDLLSPADNSTLEYYPRILTLRWTPIAGAQKYIVWIEYCQLDDYDYSFCASQGNPIGVTEESFFTFEFVGAQPGRWQVWAVDANGQEGNKSEWWHFNFTR